MAKTVLLLGAMALFTAAPAAAQETAEALGAAFLEAIQRRDESALENLIHPESRRSVSSERLSSVVKGWLRQNVQPSWGIRVAHPDSLGGYDAAARTYRIGPIHVVFPVPPERFLMVTYTQLLPAAEGRPQGTLQGEGISEAVAVHDGQWRIVVGKVEIGRR